MGNRRKARELTLQVLYQMEMQNTEPKAIFGHFWQHEEVSDEVKKFTTDLVEGNYRNRREIDALLERHSHHWKLERMAVVDRNILRVGVCELLYYHDIPVNVVLNEAIEIAKRFGTADSSAFINGILDNVAKEVRKEK